MRGPYLQALGSTSVEIRAELDKPSAASVRLSVGGADAGAARTVRDESATAMHVIRIDGLTPATRYSYALQAGDVAKGEFTTAPSRDSTDTFTFLVYGDNRTDDVGHAAIVRQMLQTPTDFLVNTGDLVADGSLDGDWRSFFDIEASLLRDRCVFASVGNHELTDGAGVKYLRYFGPTTDAHGDGEKPKLYGSFRWGDARFFLLDGMESFESGPERAWLDDELARADSESGLVWRIVVMHQSPWSAGPHGGNTRALRAGIPALFATHHIDLLLAGHDHIYERGFASGTRYLISGGGGAPVYEVERPIPSTRKVESVHHIILVTVQKDAINIVAKRDTGSVLERCGITKAREGWDCDPVSPAAPRDAPPPVPPAPASTKCACETVGVRADGSLATMALLAALAAAARRRPNRTNRD